MKSLFPVRTPVGPRFSKTLVLFSAALALLTGPVVFSQQNSDSLLAGFVEPGPSARPLVWWHWMDGNIAKEGIKLDLDWMHDVGIAGFQVFDASILTPQIVEKRLVYMTPEWKDALKYSIQLGSEHGFEMGIAGSPGWSESGGPWVPPAHGMKKYVWSETRLEGGKPFKGEIAHPPSVTGPFQNIPLPPWEASAKLQFYADAAIIGYKLPEADSSSPADVQPKITVSSGTIDGSKLSNGDLTDTVEIPIPAVGSASWIQFEYSSWQTIKSISYTPKDRGELVAAYTGVGSPALTLESSDDGVAYHSVEALPIGGPPHHTVAFKPQTGRFFRVTFKATPPPPIPDWARGSSPASFGINPNQPAKSYEVAEIVLNSYPLVDHLEEKAAFVPAASLDRYPTPGVEKSDAIDPAEIIDLSSYFDANGILSWTPPPGKWVVLRVGYSLLGITNHPATKEATGLEVDKLNRSFVKDYLEKYLDGYTDAVGGELIGRKGISNVINDSWEAGSQNWTDHLLGDFKKLRGYDPIPWLPVLTGRIVKGAEDSDRFLWDFRRTISDLIASEHYGQLSETLHAHGMKHYAESHEGGRAFDGDGMEVKKFSEVPMAAMWTQRPGINRPNFNANADCRESASVAHIYGQNIATAESMTANGLDAWGWSPATLKPTADAELLAGINRFVIHESTHQPLAQKAPGLTLGAYGQWFNRNETWANMARPWIDYLSRSSYLLQQGIFSADIAYFYGEDTNLTAIFGGHAPAIPNGYNYDYVNADALVNELGCDGSAVTTKSGMKYGLIALDPGSKSMSLPVLKALHKLVVSGATIVGAKPTYDPSLADDQAVFKRLADELFGDGSKVQPVGKGRIFSGFSISDALHEIHLAPDFSCPDSASGEVVKFVHRRIPEGEIYFINNRSDAGRSLVARFRVKDRRPELWFAESGKTEVVSYTPTDESTEVPLNLAAWGSVFVVFRDHAQKDGLTLSPPKETVVKTIDGPWTLNFQANRGAPASIVLNELVDWTSSPDAGIKYFSGIGRYSTTLEVPPEWLDSGQRVIIDLGTVKNLASVFINGKSVGTAWHAPYRVELASALRSGRNVLEIEVANLWVNRLIGDEQPGATRIAYADFKPYEANAPLSPSGLLGPVKVITEVAP